MLAFVTFKVIQMVLFLWLLLETEEHIHYLASSYIDSLCNDEDKRLCLTLAYDMVVVEQTW
jgi:hypothetical protein